MKKTRLAALFMCLIGLIFALTGVACTTDDVKEEWSFTASVPVACEEGDTVSITLNVENVTGWTATYEVTKNGEKCIQVFLSILSRAVRVFISILPALQAGICTPFFPRCMVSADVRVIWS